MSSITKRYHKIQIPYWYNKAVILSLIKLNYKTEIVFRFTVWWLHKLNKNEIDDDIEELDGEWLIGSWHHFDILNYKTKEGKRLIKLEKSETIENILNKMD